MLPSQSLPSPSKMRAPEVATPVVVFALVAAGVMPVLVPLSSAMLRVESLPGRMSTVVDPTGMEVVGLRVRMIAVEVPDTAKRAAITVFAASAVLTLPAQTAAVSDAATATFRVIGDPVMPAEVTTTLAFPAPEIVPDAVALSTWAVPATHASLPVVSLSVRSMVASSPEAARMIRVEYATFASVSGTWVDATPISLSFLTFVPVGVALARRPKNAAADVSCITIARVSKG